MANKIKLIPTTEEIIAALKKDMTDPTGKEWEFSATTEIEHWAQDHVSYTTTESGKGSFSIVESTDSITDETRWEFDFFWSSPSGMCDSVTMSLIRPNADECFEELKEMLDGFDDIDIEGLEL